MLPFNPKKPIYGFTARAPHAKRRLHLFKEGDFVYFRPKNAPLDWWGVFWGDYLLGLAAEAKNWGTVERHIRPVLQQSHIWRIFEMPDPRKGEQRMWRIIWRSDFGYACPLDSPDMCGAYFWPRPARLNLWKTTTTNIRHHFEREWYDSESDVRKALEWCELNDEERGLRGIHWHHGSLRELEVLLHASVHLLPLWNDTEEQQRVELHFWWRKRQGIVLICPYKWKQNPYWQRWQRLRRCIERQNRGTYMAEGNRSDWKFDWIKYEWPHDWSRRCFRLSKVTKPTQHERMEASLILRDWLSENAPDLLSEWFG